MFLFFIPVVGKILNIAFLDQEAEKFIIQIIKSQLDARKKKSEDDIPNFLDVFVTALEDSGLSEQSADEDGVDKTKDQFEDDAKIQNVKTRQSLYSNQAELELAIISNLFLLFFAGFDTSSTALSSILYYLATNQEGKKFCNKYYMHNLPFYRFNTN